MQPELSYRRNTKLSRYTQVVLFVDVVGGGGGGGRRRRRRGGSVVVFFLL